jgi:hypothetical protein
MPEGDIPPEYNEEPYEAKQTSDVENRETAPKPDTKTSR